MSVVCKMQCHEAPLPDEITDAPQPVGLGAVWVPDEQERLQPENAVFGNATPWGSMRLGIANPEAKKFFKPGKKYLVTFTEAAD